jgi:DNA-binding transcriptional regulator YhcF (GntR family)
MADGSLLDANAPLFAQIAQRLAAQIADGELVEGERAPSSNELAALHRINPATAGKGLNVLIDEGLLEKRRGLGMFVATGARERLLKVRREQFAARFVAPMLAEAERLDIATDEIVALIHGSANPDHTSGRPGGKARRR